VKGKSYLTLAALLATLLAGCNKVPAEPEQMPELNAENCKPDNIAKIKNEAAREQFATTCLRLPGFKPSPPRSW
jgi:entry exclusion lipoprotein TrbK